MATPRALHLEALIDQIHDQRAANLEAQAKNRTEFTRLVLERTALDAQADRANRSLPNVDVCPECYVLRGSRQPLVQETLEDPEKQPDRMKCLDCGYVEERPD